MLECMCKSRGVKSFFCPLKYSGDNGVQIAAAALVQFSENYNVFKFEDEIKNVDILPGWRIDDIETPWIKK